MKVIMKTCVGKLKDYGIGDGFELETNIHYTHTQTPAQPFLYPCRAGTRLETHSS